MQFNSETNNNDIVSDCTFLITGSYNGTIDYHINDRTRSANNKLNSVVSLILRADNRWQFDDDNFENLPEGTTDMVSGQQDYEIPVSDFLTILEVLVKDQNGDWKVLDAIDRNKGKAQDLADLESDDNNGLPLYYDKSGSSLYLYPKPSGTYTTLSGGLKVRFQRNPSYFTVTDTTKEPGIAKPFHRSISIGMATDYCLANGLIQKLQLLKEEDARMSESIVEHYSSRNRDEQPKMRLKEESYIVE